MAAISIQPSFLFVGIVINCLKCYNRCKYPTGGASMPYKEFCLNRYNELFNQHYPVFLNRRTGQTAQKQAEQAAQRIAIKDTLKEALDRYSPEIETADLWKAIYVAHLKRKSGLTTLDTIDEQIIAKVISADQSWKKASGHAFEAFIFEVANPLMEQYSIRFALQTDVHQMIKDGKIHNDGVDMTWLNQRIHTDVFDLYALVTFQNQNFVFGCIQSKTSIRDRVTRDREPSQQAMEAKFWSIAVTLDGQFLAMPKFKEMVNGGGHDYAENGWHGLYVMSELYSDDRIYSIDKQLTRLVSHARQASAAWMSARQRFNSTWRPHQE